MPPEWESKQCVCDHCTATRDFIVLRYIFQKMAFKEENIRRGLKITLSIFLPRKQKWLRHRKSKIDESENRSSLRWRARSEIEAVLAAVFTDRFKGPLSKSCFHVGDLVQVEEYKTWHTHGSCPKKICSVWNNKVSTLLSTFCFYDLQSEVKMVAPVKTSSMWIFQHFSTCDVVEVVEAVEVEAAGLLVDCFWTLSPNRGWPEDVGHSFSVLGPGARLKHRHLLEREGAKNTAEKFNDWADDMSLNWTKLWCSRNTDVWIHWRLNLCECVSSGFPQTLFRPAPWMDVISLYVSWWINQILPLPSILVPP